MSYRIPNPIKYLFRDRKSDDNFKILINKKIERNYMEDGYDIKWEDTVEFTFPITGGRVIKVYDGDTITIASKLPYEESPMYRLSVR